MSASPSKALDFSPAVGNILTSSIDTRGLAQDSGDDTDVAFQGTLSLYASFAPGAFDYYQVNGAVWDAPEFRGGTKPPAAVGSAQAPVYSPLYLPAWTWDPVTEVITFHIRYGHGDDFRSAVARAAEARQKMNSTAHYSWYRLFNGGPGGTYVLTINHANWASMEDDPAVKPLRDDLRAAFGEQEAMSVIERLNSSVEGTYSELIQFRPDLSYTPAK